MKKVIAAFIALLLGILLVSLANGITDEESAAASVTVNEFISITLTDTGVSGFSFGNINPGTQNTKEAAQADGNASSTPAATVANDAVSNVNAKISLKGTNFAGAGTIAVGNVAYDDDGGVDQSVGSVDTIGVNQSSLATAYPGTEFTTLGTGANVKIWFWLDVPSGQAAGLYNSTFSFQGSTT